VFCSEGGYFNAIMSFPPNYPNSPPSVRFTSDMWHPNVYPDGRVCISILHAPGDDPNGYELASERWSPVHTVNFSCELLTLASENGENTHHIQPCSFGYCHEHTISGNFLDRR
jgi:ubiquitin-protein ligase